MEGNTFCTLACYKRYAQAGAAGASWHNDGKNGKNDQNCSENLLIRLFLSDPDKYANFRDPTPLTKKDICQQWADQINSHGVQMKRTAKQVQNKVECIERQMRVAIDFADSQTGVGLQESDPDSWERAIMLRCKFYHELREVFIERAGMMPSATTEDIIGDSSSDSESDSDVSYADDTCSEPVDLTNDDDKDGDQSGGSSTAPSSTKKKRRKEITAMKDKSPKGKAKRTKSKSSKKKATAEGKHPRGPTTDDLLRQVLQMRKEEMEESKKRRQKRKEHEEEKRKRTKFEDYDLNNYEQFVQLGEMFKKICNVYDGDKVRAALQFPEFAQGPFLTDEEKHKLHEMQQQQQQERSDEGDDDDNFVDPQELSQAVAAAKLHHPHAIPVIDLRPKKDMDVDLVGVFNALPADVGNTVVVSSEADLKAIDKCLKSLNVKARVYLMTFESCLSKYDVTNVDNVPALAVLLDAYADVDLNNPAEIMAFNYMLEQIDVEDQGGHGEVWNKACEQME